MQLSTISLALTRLGGLFSPASLFAGGTVAGAWYDPSDLSTMFDTSTGTTPVAMPGQGAAVPVGLMLDKSQNGVGTNGAKRVNLLTYSEEFNNAAWVKANVTVTANAAVAPDGTTTADLMYPTTSGLGRSIYQTINNGSLISVYAKASGISFIAFANTAGSAGAAWFDLSTGAVGTVAAGYTASIEDVGLGWYKCSLEALSGVFTFAQIYTTNSNNSLSVTASGTDGVFLWGADLRLASEANTLPLYQPITSSWYSTLPGNHAIAANDSTKRPVLMARVNLLTYSEEFDNGAWITNNTSISTNAIIAPDGSITGDTLTENSSTTSHSVNRAGSSIAFVSSTEYVLSAYAKNNGRRYLQLYWGGGASSVFYGNFDLQDGIVGTTGFPGAAGSSVSSSITDVGGGWYRCVLTLKTRSDQTGATSVLFVLSNSASALSLPSYTGDGTSGIYIWGADLRPANIGANVPAYQRIADALTYDTNGFPLYLYFDGADDSMYTPASIPFATVTSDGQARRNLLNNPTQFDVTTSWTATNVTLASGISDAFGGNSAWTITASAANGTISQGVGTLAANSAISCYIKRRTGTGAIALWVGNAYTNITVTSVWARIQVNQAALTAGYFDLRISTSGDAVDVMYPQVETNSTATAFQNIGTDKATVFAGVRQTAAGNQQLVEFSADVNANNGAFSMPKDAVGAAIWTAGLRGTTATSASSSAIYAAPITTVNTGLYDIGLSTDEAKLRINGAQVATSGAGSAGTGNFGTYPLYIGSRNNSSVWFNGHLYSLVVAGSAVSAGNISATEQWVAGKTGIAI